MGVCLARRRMQAFGRQHDCIGHCGAVHTAGSDWVAKSHGKPGAL
jgi:hypothetical protein